MWEHFGKNKAPNETTVSNNMLIDVISHFPMQEHV